MKNIMKLVFLMIAVLGISSCDLLNVDVDTTLSGVMDISVEEDMAKGSLSWTHFDKEITIEPSTEMDEHKDNIKKVGVGNVVTTVLSVTKKGVPVDNVMIQHKSMVTISSAGFADAVYILPEDWHIVEKAKFQLEDQDGFYGEIGAMLGETKAIKIVMDGHSSETGVEISLEFSIEATVTGSIF